MKRGLIQQVFIRRHHKITNMDFGHGVDKEGYYQAWPAHSWAMTFLEDGKLRPEEDIKAIIYAMGGPLPSKLRSYKMKAFGSEIRIYLDAI